MASDTDSTTDTTATNDPRERFAAWANDSDEWVRYLVGQVLSGRCAACADDIEHAYQLLRQEKAIDERVLPVVAPLAIDQTSDDAEEPLSILKIADITGVNALISGAVIEPHAGLTILFGENGTGKTGYARILKAVADSRTADEVLGDISEDVDVPQAATIAYRLGDEDRTFAWTGERGQPPFTRMSIFDNLSVNFHVDDELEYVYVPAVLALFNHVATAIKAVRERVVGAADALSIGSTTLLGRFPRDSEVYPLIETLGASTDLVHLKSRASQDPKVDDKIEALRKAVAALDANSLAPTLAAARRSERVLAQAGRVLDELVASDVATYNNLLDQRTQLRADYKAFRETLFAAAALPAEPEETWEGFVSSGEAYRAHLTELGVHDASKCLYCRQALGGPALDLVRRYGDYLADKIGQDIATATQSIGVITKPVLELAHGEVSAMLAEFKERGDKPDYYDAIATTLGIVSELQAAYKDGSPVDESLLGGTVDLRSRVRSALDTTTATATSLQSQLENRATELVTRKKELSELIAAAELTKSWTEINAQVRNAKEADRLKIVAGSIPNLSRAVTELSKAASDQLVNHNFEMLFEEECEELRAPVLKVEFFGQQGKAQRRKVLSARCKPSKVLSEGEQKVLAMADFLAEARLSGITAPVIFDDPVSSLDHRRINEVALRVANLAEGCQVIVFTHDIFFATTLLSLFEKSKRCAYYQITDEDGKGRVTRATGPRWDTLPSLKKRVNEAIQLAKLVDGESRAALVREGYGWVRSWCEVFTEKELLEGVTERYQPNVRMSGLSRIKSEALPTAIATVTRVFDDACRYIDAHSQPLATLGVSPTLAGLEADWDALLLCRKGFLEAER